VLPHVVSLSTSISLSALSVSLTVSLSHTLFAREFFLSLSLSHSRARARARAHTIYKTHNMTHTQFMRELKKLNDTADWTFSRPNSSSTSTGGREGEGTRRSSFNLSDPDHPNVSPPPSQEATPPSRLEYKPRKVSHGKHRAHGV